ncbi:MAG: hypothetical protein ACRCX8_03760 [Sarcina sp.]
MNISELKVKDIRATIDIEDEQIVIRNPKGKVKQDLLQYFQEQVNINVKEADKKVKNKKIASDIDIVKLLMSKLTNIAIDENDLTDIFKNPSYELSVVMLYLSSIMQELIFEVLSIKNLEVRMSKNIILEKDTLRMVRDLGDATEEMIYRKTIENGEKIQ